MPTYLTIQYAGTEKSFADWGILMSSCRHTRRNLAPGTYECFVPADNITAAPTFAFEGVIIVRRNRTSGSGAPDSFADGDIGFIGKRLDVRLVHEGHRAGYHYTFANAWYDLENTLYQQEVASKPTTVAALYYPFVSGLTLFAELDPTGHQMVALTTGEQIQRILQFLLNQYAAQGMAAPYSIGTIDPAQSLPSFEVQEMSCATAIQKCLELHPDCVLDFNYATYPPTVHVRKRVNLAAVNLPYICSTAADGVKSCAISPRQTLVPRAVLVYYRVAVSVNNTTWINLYLDKYGPNGQNSASDHNAGLRVIVQTLDMQGSRFSNITAALDCEAVSGLVNGNNAQRIAWWSDPRGGGRTELPTRLAVDGDMTDLQISLPDIMDDDGNDITVANYPNRLISGAIHPWMEYLGNAVEGVRAKIVATADWQETGKTSRTTAYFTTQITLTNGITASYSAVTETLGGEPIPGFTGYDGNGKAVFANGVAKALFDAMSTLQYEADHIRVADMPTGNVTLLNQVNLTGGRAEWATMNAQVQEVIEDDGQGYTSVKVGPAKYFTSDNMAAIWRFNQWRRSYNTLKGRETATGADTGNIIEL